MNQMRVNQRVMKKMKMNYKQQKNGWSKKPSNKI